MRKIETRDNNNIYYTKKKKKEKKTIHGTIYKYNKKTTHELESKIKINK